MKYKRCKEESLFGVLKSVNVETHRHPSPKEEAVPFGVSREMIYFSCVKFFKENTHERIHCRLVQSNLYESV